MNPVTAFLVTASLGIGVVLTYWVDPLPGLAFIVLAVILAFSLKMANTWQKFVILRLGKLHSVKGAGLFAIVPVIDNVIAVIDVRIQTTAFNAEQALTRDTVPVNVDAIIFWHVHDAEKAALAITNYREAIDRVAQTSLREMIGMSMLTALLSAYLVYGIAFEAHQQNSFIMLDADYAPVQLLARDFGDLRIHGPTLRGTGLAIDAYRAGFTVYDDDEPVRDKLLHAVLLCHLSELALLLARTYAHPEHHFWDVLRREIENVFGAVRARVDAARWHAERAALLEHDWPAKAFLRMRLSDTQDDVHGTMPNPLA